MGLFSRKKPEAKEELFSEEELKVLPESVKSFTREDLEYMKSCGGKIYGTFGTQDLDSILSYYAPVHEKRQELMFDGICKILENQKQILEELASLRQVYQKPENAAAPSYSKPSTR